MRHKRKVNHFGRKSGPRVALLRGLVDSLVLNERIQTTLPKAKELRRHIERAITKGKNSNLATRRLLLSRYPNKATVSKIISVLSPKFKERAGGYTRIIRIGKRMGDNAEMAFIEFVDYQKPALEESKTIKLDLAMIKKKKHLRRKRLNHLQSKGRRISRSCNI